MEEQKTQNQKCRRCKVEYIIDNFNRKRNGVLLKTCKRCLEKNKEYTNKKKCEHGRQQPQCFDCRGSQYCEHGKIKSTCVVCGGNRICEHSRIADVCKKCNDPFKITIKNMVSHSKQTDKKNNRYDQTNFIDYCFVENLIDDCENKCYYCKCELQYKEYTDNLATIERLNNDLGHTKGNCVIACRTCNFSRVGDSIN
jgi:hypothetical protein